MCSLDVDCLPVAEGTIYPPERRGVRARYSERAGLRRELWALRMLLQERMRLALCLLLLLLLLPQLKRRMLTSFSSIGKILKRTKLLKLGSCERLTKSSRCAALTCSSQLGQPQSVRYALISSLFVVKPIACEAHCLPSPSQRVDLFARLRLPRFRVVVCRMLHEINLGKSLIRQVPRALNLVQAGS